MEYAPELAFSGTVVNNAWAGVTERAGSACSPPRPRVPNIFTMISNRAEAVRILAAVSRLNAR